MNNRSAWADHRLVPLLLALVLITHVAWMVYTGYINEDAFITFRFARNIAYGQGFTYNSGEPVYGTTTPLFTFMMAIWLLVCSDPIPGVQLFNLLAVLGTVILTYRALEVAGSGGPQRTAATLMLLLSSRLLFLNTMGMEGPLCTLFLAASWLAYRRERWNLTGICLGALLWVRLDTAVWVVILILGAFLIKPVYGARIALTAGAAYIPWVIYSWQTFGSPIPMSVIAKYWSYYVMGSAGSAPLLEPVVSMLLFRLEPVFNAGLRMNPFGMRTQISPWGVIGTTLSTFLIVAGMVISWRKGFLRELTVFILFELARLIVFRQTFLDRYFIPVLWTDSILIGFLIGSFWEGRIETPLLRATRLLIPGTILLFSVLAVRVNAEDLRNQQQYRNEASLKRIGLWLRDHAQPATTVQLEPLGYIGYFSELPMLDEVGIVTPEVVELKKRGVTDSLGMIRALSPGAFVVHCDDMKRLASDSLWVQSSLNLKYDFAYRSDPLDFLSDTGSTPPSDNLARNACYEVWIE